MARSRVAITLDDGTLQRVDRLVQQALFVTRSQVIQEAVEEKLARLERSTLARESAKLDPAFERPWPRKGFQGKSRNGPNTKGRNRVAQNLQKPAEE